MQKVEKKITIVKDFCCVQCLVFREKSIFCKKNLARLCPGPANFVRGLRHLLRSFFFNFEGFEIRIFQLEAVSD